MRDWARWHTTGRPPNDEARRTDAGVMLLSADPKATVAQHYLGTSPPGDRPAMPEATVSRRLGRIHLLLHEHLRSADDAARRREERLEMQKRLLSRD